MDPLLHYLSTNLKTLRSFLLEGLYVQMVQEVWFCTLRQITLSVLALGTPLYYRHLLKRLQELEGFFLQLGAERVPPVEPPAAARRRSPLDAPDSAGASSASASVSASDADAATPTPAPNQSQNQSQSVSSPKSQSQQQHQQLARRDSQYERLLRETAALLESLEFSLAYRTRSTELLALEAFEWVIESVGKSVRCLRCCA